MSDQPQSTALERPRQQDDDCGNRCRDFDEDCFGITDKLACWKYAPEQGVCPFLAGEMRDETI